jgi:CheY-like chemotaxis protein
VLRREKPQLLVVDDDEMVLWTVELILGEMGAREIRLASTGEQAQAILSTTTDQDWIVLTDFQMPNGDGKWLCQRILEKRLPVRAVFVMSGALDFRSSFVGLQREFSSRGVQFATLDKPISTGNLRRIFQCV